MYFIHTLALQHPSPGLPISQRARITIALMAAKITAAGAAVARSKAKIAAIKAEINKANAKMDALEAKVYARITALKAEN